MSGYLAIDQAFANNSQLRKRILDAIDTTPQHAPLFTDIARYHLTTQSANGGAVDDEPASKRRKLPNGASLAVTDAQKNQPREVLLEARDISFSLPQRKKLHLGIAQYGTDINGSETTFAVFTQNPATNEVDMEVPLTQYAYALRLPVPEKAAKQYNFILLPKPGLGNNTEPIIWSVNAGPLKSCNIPNDQFAKIASGPDDVLESALGFVLRQTSTSLSLPTPEEFHSATPEAHRKGDKAYHVKAFRGSKDGYLFFLSNGIFFGFKKPLAFFAFEDIESISYTSVLQRTFNLSIAYRASGADVSDANSLQEVEFSMLDQADFSGIDAYLKRHELQDASLAEARRAKKLKSGKIAPVTNGEDTGDTVDEDGRTELEKAQQQLDDEEDEEEEDYDPGSDGESEGSGHSEDDDDEYDRDFEKQRKKTGGKDLVKEELGSEAEDVSVTEDEEEEEEGEEEGEENEGGDEYEEDEEQEDEGDREDVDHLTTEAGQTNPLIASIPTHGGHWKYMPDPDDDDQL